MKRLTTTAALLLLLAAFGHAQTKETYPCRKQSSGIIYGDPSPGTARPSRPAGVPAYTKKEVTKPAELLDRPEPTYTDEATAAGTTGTVRLRLVLCPNGTVDGVKALSRLPHGLTEKAIEAAHRIRFVPAELRGKRVAQLVTIDYNFSP
jgi:TonB family protein